jgi:two-component system, OmpR family, phosphate regulon sensor histidine kinase PhoR
MFFLRPNFFPKQLFLRFLVQQIFGVVPALFLAALIARLYLESRLSNLQTTAEVIQAYDKAFLFLALVMAFIVSGISLWTGYRLVLPLGRILVKARSILKRDYSASRDLHPEEDELGEWSDLESTLHRIGRDMQNKDISLSKEREEIETIMSAIREAVVAVDRNGDLLFFNSQFVAFFGDLLRKKGRISDFFRSPDIIESFRSTLNTGKPHGIDTKLRLKGESQVRHFSLSVTSLKLEDGSIYGAVGVFHDVTELKRMDQVRIDFVANVSHELRTPLTSIKGYAQTLKDDSPPGSAPRKYLETIERNTDRLIALVQDLLNLSALESGADLEKEVFSVKNITEKVLAQLDNIRIARNHTVVQHFEFVNMNGDPKRVEQVVFNLLENAFKYMPTGGAVEIYWEDKGSDHQLRIKDNGLGIPEEHHSRVFERFYRIDSARNREQGGTGLGLAIVKHIVQRHGGKIQVSGGLGKGTEFTCTFPKQAGI